MTDRANVTASATTMMTATGRSLATLASAARGTILTASAADTIAAIDAKTAGNVVTGDGTDVVSVAIATPLAVATAANRIALGLDIADPMTGSGWSSYVPAHGQTTTWSGGKLTLTTPSGVSAGDECGAYRSFLPAGEEYDVAARIDITSADGDSGANVNLTVGTDASNHRVYWQLRFNGSLQGGGFAGGGWITAVAATPADTIVTGDRTSGQLWLRIRRRYGLLLFYTGVGSAGALPTSWTVQGTSTNASLLGSSCTFGGKVVTLSMDTAGPATAATVEILSLSATEQALVTT